jgi:hypothetical protein
MNQTSQERKFDRFLAEYIDFFDTLSEKRKKDFWKR